MTFQDLIVAAQQHYPTLRVKYKSQSPLMKLWSYILFFNKDFMSDYTTLYHTVYLPNSIKLHPVSSVVLFLHELVRMHRSKKQACLSSLYVIWKLSQILHFKPHLEVEIKSFAHWQHKPWLKSSSLEQQLQVATQKIQNGERPYQDDIFDILDDLISKV